MDEEQQYCLRWNNFQANITSQFEALRDDEDFTDVTIACDGQRIQAHKVVLSACSPLFKDLFKNNPCPHPIIFMRDVEARSITALLEFMYAGEVNVAQAHLSGFLRTAESLKIRGLTESNTDLIRSKEATAAMDVSASKTREEGTIETSPLRNEDEYEEEVNNEKRLKEFEAALNDNNNETSANLNHNLNGDDGDVDITDFQDITVRQVKEEFPEYHSDVDEERDNKFMNHRIAMNGLSSMDLSRTSLTQFNSSLDQKFVASRSSTRTNGWSTFEMRLRGTTTPETIDSSHNSNRLIKLADGIEIPEEQLRGVKWNDYRKLTRGLATILFSPSELATCSVTGQRWSRAGNDPRPVKPALDRAKVQAIISYVSSRFPVIEISRIKQVLAYKCKENSTAFKMKAVRYFADHGRDFKNK